MEFSFNCARKFRLYIFIAVCLNLCEIINGYGVAWPGPVLPKFNDPSQSPLSYKVTELQKSWIASVTFFGHLGAFSGGYLANMIGRKKSIIIGGVTHLATYTLLTFGSSLPMLYVARFMVGTSVCFMMVVSFMYIGETAPPNIRGIIMTSMGVSHASGSLLIYCIGPFVEYVTVGYVAIGLNILFLTVCCFLPESPMFYVLKGDEDSARSALLHLGRSEDVNTELKAMIAKVKEQRSYKRVWKELFELKCNRKSLFITVFLNIFQQSSGIMVVIYYANTIFRFAGSSIHPDIAAIIVGATFVVGAVVAPTVIDKYGRRILLLVSTGVLVLSMTGLGIYFYLRETLLSSVVHLGWLPLMLLIVAQFAYSFGLSIIPNTLLGELFSSRIRGVGSPISISSGMISGFVSTTLFSYIVISLGIHFTFWIFAICNASAFLFVIFFVPETMGKSLMEIQEMLEK